MMTRILILLLGAILMTTTSAYAGAAVAKTKMPKGPRSVSPQQLPPGYVMTPEGVKKIEEPLIEEVVDPAEVKDIVDMSQLVESLSTSSEAWDMIISRDDKALVVEEFIKKYASEGVAIKKSALYYVEMINQMSVNSKDMLGMPFERVLQVVAVMEYDFGNGQNPDMLAQKILGQQVYERNRQRLMAQQQGH